MKNKIERPEVYIDNKFMKEALAEAKKAYKKDEIPIGAVIVKKGKIIGRGHNLRESENNPLAHAEMIAIKAASMALDNWRLIDCDLYVTVEPCPMCAGAIQQSRIKKLVYGIEDQKSGAVDTVTNILQNNNLNHQTEVVSGILKYECKEIMQSFFSKLR